MLPRPRSAEEREDDSTKKFKFLDGRLAESRREKAKIGRDRKRSCVCGVWGDDSDNWSEWETDNLAVNFSEIKRKTKKIKILWVLSEWADELIAMRRVEGDWFQE